MNRVHRHTRDAVLGLLALSGLALVAAPSARSATGAMWWLWVFAGILACTLPVESSSPAQRGAARVWWLTALAGLVLSLLGALVWQERFRVVEAEARLALGALAAAWLAGHLAHARVARWALHATALACVVAAGVATFTEGRALPSNAIPWAAGVACLVAVLAPRAIDRWKSADSRARPWEKWLWAIGVGTGLAAVLLSRSRGAFGLVLLLVLLPSALDAVRGGLNAARLARSAALIALTAAALAATAWLPQDPLRVRAGWEQMTHPTQRPQDTELGSRMLLWGMAWDGIRESPWIGHGQNELRARIHEEATRARSAHFGGLAHAHSEYLNAWFAHGLPGLLGVLLPMVGLAVMAWRLRREDAVAALQLAGLFAIHASTSLTNANLAHQLYAALLSTGAAIALVGVRSGDDGGDGS